MYPTIIPGNVNNLFDYRSKLLALTDGVMPTNVKLGASFGAEPLQFTQGDYYDYIFKQTRMAPPFEACFASDTPLGIHVNATPWADERDQSVDVLSNFLEKYGNGVFLQKDRSGNIRNRFVAQNPENDELISGGVSQLEMQLTLSRNATLVQNYFRRNNRMVARQQNWYREQHPDIVAFASMSSEFQQNNAANGEYCDYSDSTKQEFRDWLSGAGFYVGEAQYANLATFNSAFGLSYSSWDNVNPPTTINWSVGSYWNKWHEFRVVQVNNIVQEQIKWTIDGGLTPDQVYGHQTHHDPATTDDGKRMHAGYWTTTFVEEGGNGITTYNDSAWDTTLFGVIKNNDKNWGNFEYNPLQPTISQNLFALETVWDNDAHINCPCAWSGAAPYGITGTVFETAIQQFFSNHFADSFTGLKTYEADPSGNDVIWTMSYGSDVENSANISSMEFTNGIMSANINVYKINLMESASWREKNIDNLKFYFGATDNSEIKLDWFRLEANHCWHFDDSGEIFGQNQLGSETFSGSEFSATTTGGDGYFYLSTDKQAIGEHADRAFINSKFYKKIRIKMTSSASGTAQILWWQRDSTIGSKNFAVASGTQTTEDILMEPVDFSIRLMTQM